MKIIANVTLVKAGGEVAPGDTLNLPEAEARSLIERGFARPHTASKDPAPESTQADGEASEG